jgi:glycerol-3-phosphate O-acyltransferase
MMFRRSQLLVALTALLSSPSTAWVLRPSVSTSRVVSAGTTVALSPSSATRLYSAVEKEVETAAAPTPAKTKKPFGQKVEQLRPEYEAAVDAAMAKLTAMIGDDKDLLSMLRYFIGEYLGCAQQAYQAAAAKEGITKDELAIHSPQAAAGRILSVIGHAQKYGMPGAPDKYSFDVSHTALRGRDPEKENGNTFDFYEWGCAFFRSCMDLDHSVFLGQDHLHKAMQQVEAGDNVVFFANHQTEADPQVVSCMFEKMGYGEQAAAMTYVAGHKVTTDPLAVAFSMGRTLICIHSKKHINSDPDKKSIKQKQNLQAMNAMLRKFKAGGCLIWVAPSGGRDRRNVDTGIVDPAPFDFKTIDMFRLMGNKSKKPMHYYPMAMVTYDLCPPPDYVKADDMEERNVRFVPVGVAIGKEQESVGGLESRKEFCHKSYQTCLEDYHKLQKELGLL